MSSRLNTRSTVAPANHCWKSVAVGSALRTPETCNSTRSPRIAVLRQSIRTNATSVARVCFSRSGPTFPINIRRRIGHDPHPWHRIRVLRLALWPQEVGRRHGQRRFGRHHSRRGRWQPNRIQLNTPQTAAAVQSTDIANLDQRIWGRCKAAPDVAFLYPSETGKCSNSTNALMYSAQAYAPFSGVRPKRPVGLHHPKASLHSDNDS